MTDYKELVKDLRYCADADTACSECRRFGITCEVDLHKEAADAIEQLSNARSAYGRGWTLGYDAGREESKPRWIPVTEEQDGKV